MGDLSWIGDTTYHRRLIKILQRGITRLSGDIQLETSGDSLYANAWQKLNVYWRHGVSETADAAATLPAHCARETITL